MRANIASGVLCLVVAAVFWLELDVDNPLGELFPKLILVLLAALGVALLVLGLVRKEAETTDETRTPRRWRLFVLSLVVLLAWSVTLGLVGFTISGVAAFVACTLIIRRSDVSPKRVARDLGVGIVLVVACALLFMRVLHVPLPVSTVLGI